MKNKLIGALLVSPAVIVYLRGGFIASNGIDKVNPNNVDSLFVAIFMIASALLIVAGVIVGINLLKENP